MRAMDWVNLFALAVNEENAAGHRIVTAPTNGAAGVVPAVLGYPCPTGPEAGALGAASTVRVRAGFGPLARVRLASDRANGAKLMSAGVARPRLPPRRDGDRGFIKTNASIAGAEVGAGRSGIGVGDGGGGTGPALGGSPGAGGETPRRSRWSIRSGSPATRSWLVQILRIERNAIAAVKAINAARTALWSDGRHQVSFDAVIETMRQTGTDSGSKYKETSAGGPRRQRRRMLEALRVRERRVRTPARHGAHGATRRGRQGISAFLVRSYPHLSTILCTHVN